MGGRHISQIHRDLRQQLAAGDSHLRPERQRLVLERRLGRGAVRQARLDVLELRSLGAFVEKELICPDSVREPEWKRTSGLLPGAAVA